MKNPLSKLTHLGLAAKLTLVVFASIASVALTLAMVATSQLQTSMERAYQSKGEAIAVSLAAAAEQNLDGDTSTAQGSVDSNKSIDGIAYIYVEDFEHQPTVHTFSPSFPESMRGKNAIGVDGLSSSARVQVLEISFAVDDADGGGQRQVRAMDIAAPISGGALGTVHVGMDLMKIEATVAQLRTSMLLIGGGVAIAGIVAALLLVLLTVVRPLRELTRATSAIVSKGDLTQEIRVQSRDEIGQLADSFRSMVQKLREIPVSLTDATRVLHDAVNNLSKSSSEHGQMLTRQAAALQETQVTAQEIKQTSLLASQKAEIVLAVAERADQISREGEAAIEQSLGGLNDIRSRVEEIAQKINQLSERTLQIGSITQTVKDLADQSNMLALNAAIEAVRSGEHGKGFAVVAREIRSLADQSIKATQKVREILDDISGAIRTAVSITDKGVGRMEVGLVQMKSSGENLRELSGIVKDNASAVRQIAAAVNQQNAGITQIFTAVTDLSKMMEDTITRLDATNSATVVLQEVSDNVSSIVKSYRV
jgi:methyl-accepting chemotaxis protein